MAILSHKNSPAQGLEGAEPARVMIVHNFVLDANGNITRVRIFFDHTCVE
jgi:hypothetical protein